MLILLLQTYHSNRATSDFDPHIHVLVTELILPYKETLGTLRINYKCREASEEEKGKEGTNRVASRVN
jgi:hypothetical protein